MVIQYNWAVDGKYVTGTTSGQLTEFSTSTTHVFCYKCGGIKSGVSWIAHVHPCTCDDAPRQYTTGTVHNYDLAENLAEIRRLLERLISLLEDKGNGPANA